MKLKEIPALEEGLIHVIIETPRGSQSKYTYDPKRETFELSKVLPMGTVFPFDFGFIPNTQAEDGDPLDVLVIVDQPCFPGCLLKCRPIGILKAKQKEKGGEKVRNDRLVAVADCSIEFADLKNIRSLNKNMITEIENFFIDYNKHEGKSFKPISWNGPKEAVRAIREKLVD